MPITDAEARKAGFRSAAEHDQHVRAHLDDLYAEARAEGRAPSPSELWADLHGVSGPDKPLSVAEAAARAGVHHQTIRRRLPALADAQLAHKIGGKWLLEPNALDALKKPPRPSVPTKANRRRRRPQGGPDSELW